MTVPLCYGNLLLAIEYRYCLSQGPLGSLFGVNWTAQWAIYSISDIHNCSTTSPVRDLTHMIRRDHPLAEHFESGLVFGDGRSGLQISVERLSSCSLRKRCKGTVRGDSTITNSSSLPFPSLCTKRVGNLSAWSRPRLESGFDEEYHISYALEKNTVWD